METILDNEAIRVSHDASKKLLYVVWTAESENITHDFFREINELYVEITANRPTSVVFLNTQNFTYTISVEMQTWVNENIVSKLIANGISRFAFLMSSEFIAQLSIEQTMEDVEDTFVRYFDEESEAIKWLLK